MDSRSFLGGPWLTACLKALTSSRRPWANVAHVNPDGGVARALPTKIAIPARVSDKRESPGRASLHLVPRDCLGCGTQRPQRWAVCGSLVEPQLVVAQPVHRFAVECGGLPLRDTPPDGVAVTLMRVTGSCRLSRRRAAAHLRRERREHTPQPTALALDDAAAATPVTGG
jgi:hypothetical protein